MAVSGVRLVRVDELKSDLKQPSLKWSHIYEFSRRQYFIGCRPGDGSSKSKSDWWCSTVLSRQGAHMTQSHALCWRSCSGGNSSMQMTHGWYSTTGSENGKRTISKIQFPGEKKAKLTKFPLLREDQDISLKKSVLSKNFQAIAAKYSLNPKELIRKSTI